MFAQSRGRVRFFLNTMRGVREFPKNSPSLYTQDSPELYEKGPFQQLAVCDPRLTSCREAVASPYADLHIKSNVQCHLETADQNRVTYPDVSSALRSSEDESSQNGGGFCHGVTDLEATLVYSDEEEEKSTGSAHSELVCHLRPPPALLSRPLYDPMSTRKRGSEELDEEEVDSSLSKRQRSDETDHFHGFGWPDASMIGTASAESGPFWNGLKDGDDCCLDQSADELQMLCDDFGFEMPEQQCSSCSKDEGGDSISSGSARESRRQKMKATVKLLREAIPGGDCMDTAIVLDKAIHYVKLLQLQVQTLGAKRLAERAAR